MKGFKIWAFAFTMLALICDFAVAATPSESGYQNVPQKSAQETAAPSNKNPKIREKDVRPEEVYKYGVQEFSIIAGDTGFFPSRIIVRKNIPVKIYLTAASEKKLCFVSDDFMIRVGLAPQLKEEVNLLPTKEGQYRFYCPVGDISGSIVVRD